MSIQVQILYNDNYIYLNSVFKLYLYSHSHMLAFRRGNFIFIKNVRDIK